MKSRSITRRFEDKLSALDRRAFMFGFPLLVLIAVLASSQFSDSSDSTTQLRAAGLVLAAFLGVLWNAHIRHKIATETITELHADIEALRKRLFAHEIASNYDGLTGLPSLWPGPSAVIHFWVCMPYRWKTLYPFRSGTAPILLPKWRQRMQHVSRCCSVIQTPSCGSATGTSSFWRNLLKTSQESARWKEKSGRCWHRILKCQTKNSSARTKKLQAPVSPRTG